MALISLSAFIFVNVIVGLLHAVVALEKSIFSDPRKPCPNGEDCGKYAESSVNMLPEKSSQKANKLVKAVAEVSSNNQIRGGCCKREVVLWRQSPLLFRKRLWMWMVPLLLRLPQGCCLRKSRHPQPLVKCAALKNLKRRPREGRTVVKVPTTKLQKSLKRSFASDDSTEQRPKKAKLQHEAYIRVARKAPTSLRRDEFEVETPLLRKFLGRKAGEEVTRLRNKRSEFLIQQEAERDSLCSDLFDVMVEAVDESITDEKELAHMSARNKRNMWLLRVALAERSKERERQSAGEELVDEEDDDEYFLIEMTLRR